MEAEIMEPVSPLVQFLLKQYAQCPWIVLLIAMMVIDVCTGIVAAIYERRLSSKVGYKGMMKKASLLLVVGCAGVLEQAILVTLPETLRGNVVLPLAKITAGFFVVNEALSVLENAKRSGAPLPSFLTKSLVDTIDKLNALGASLPKEGHTHIEVKDAKIDVVTKPLAHDPIPPAESDASPK